MNRINALQTSVAHLSLKSLDMDIYEYLHIMTFIKFQFEDEGVNISRDGCAISTIHMNKFVYTNKHNYARETKSTPENKSYIVQYIAQLPGNVLMEL